jgi:predicted AAA+ superfamily ATPase
MMFKEVLVEQNKHWQGIKYAAGIKRTFTKTVNYMDNDFIIAICGVRRAGKSTLLKQIINHCIEVKIPIDNTDEEEEIQINGFKIFVTPAWKYFTFH